MENSLEIRVDGKVLNEFTEFLDTTSEAWKKITDAIQEFANSLSEIFDLSIRTKEETYNIENSYHKPKKNEYLKSQTFSLYQVERRVQKHLPMGFFYFKRRKK